MVETVLFAVVRMTATPSVKKTNKREILRQPRKWKLSNQVASAEDVYAMFAK